MTLKLAWANARRSYKDFAIYFFTLMIGVAVFYAFNSIQMQSAVLALNDTQAQALDAVGMLVDMVSVVIIAILTFLVVYASRFLIKRRNKEFGLYLLLGMTRARLLCLMAAETVMVGAASLIAGLIVGVAMSQLLVAVSAAMFVVDMSSGFTFLFAPDMAAKTVVVFAIIFALSLLINVGYLVRARLIDLINADRKNDALKLRSIPLCFVLFIVAVVLIAVAYKTLLDNGLVAGDGSFQLATVLVCVGTLLFFYSLAGFLLRVLQSITPVYYRGLNMFVLRQVASRINSTFISMGVICITLFLAITSVCGGIGICNATQGAVDQQTHYDASVRTYYDVDGTGANEGAAGNDDAPTLSTTKDMAAGLRESALVLGNNDWDTTVRKTAQLDFYASDTTFADTDAILGKKLIDYSSAVSSYAEQQSYSLVKLSQYNEALEMAGLQPVSVPAGQVMLSSDFAETQPYLRDVAVTQKAVSIYGREFTLVPDISTTTIETTSVAHEAGFMIINDDEFPQEAQQNLWTSILDVQYYNASDEDAFNDMLKTIQRDDGSNGATWPVSMYQTKQDVFAQSVNTTTMVSYLAIYIGLVLVVACAAILAIQQLTAASDNRRRYQLLSKLGATQGMIDGALFKQIAIAFFFPLALAIAHSICALAVVMDVVSLFGQIEIGTVATITAAAFLVVYALYFALTYFQARSVIRSTR